VIIRRRQWLRVRVDVPVACRLSVRADNYYSCPTRTPSSGQENEMSVTIHDRRGPTTCDGCYRSHSGPTRAVMEAIVGPAVAAVGTPHGRDG